MAKQKNQKIHNLKTAVKSPNQYFNPTSQRKIPRINGVYHNPYGNYSPYDNYTGRVPRDPVEGESTILYASLPFGNNEKVWVTYTVNGVEQTPINGSNYTSDSSNNYFQMVLDNGTLRQYDKISYIVHATIDGAEETTVGPFDFVVSIWQVVERVSSIEVFDTHVTMDAIVSNTSLSTAKLNFAFTNVETLHIQVSPSGMSPMQPGIKEFTASQPNDNTFVLQTAALTVAITLNPFSYLVSDAENIIIVQSLPNTLKWAYNEVNFITEFSESYQCDSKEEFFGFGEQYIWFDKRGQTVQAYLINHYLEQEDGAFTYFTSPYFTSSKSYGYFLNSDYYSEFKMATKDLPTNTIQVTRTGGYSPNETLDYYIISGENLNSVTGKYTDITGKPTLLPRWAYGLWMSANEWKDQGKVEEVIEKVSLNDIPGTVLVLDQWSDEETYYIFHDAKYTSKQNGEIFKYSDFTYGESWPNPKEMAEKLHAKGIKLILMQLPIAKYDETPNEQRENDQAYMKAQQYQVRNKDGSDYRLNSVPKSNNNIYDGSLLLDFTKKEARDWWMSQRDYLLDEVGVDGFRCTGGEMVFGKDAVFSNGKDALEMHNRYPSNYIKSYFDYLETKKGIGNAVTLSRAGNFGGQTTGCYWAGDQTSDFNSLHAAVTAGLTINISGAPYWCWNLAGDTISSQMDYPSSQVYQRSAAMAAFSPIMIFDSVAANPTLSDERSPWNAAERTGDIAALSTFQKFANVHMSLLPYIYTEAKYTSDTGIPMMRPMIYEFTREPNIDGGDTQYMFGGSLLVSPIYDAEGFCQTYFPEGAWHDLWDGNIILGGQMLNFLNLGLSTIPVYARNGAIIPMNLSDTYQLGDRIGNDLSVYQNLTFRIYPFQRTSYDFYDDVRGSVTRTIVCDENFAGHQVTITIPEIEDTVTLQLHVSDAEAVSVNGAQLQNYEDLADFLFAATGTYYDTEQNLFYVKIPSSNSSQSVVLSDVDQAPYEAEFGELKNVTVETIQEGYTGYGYVNSNTIIDEANWVTFHVFAESSGDYNCDVRYSTGNGTAIRSIIVNNVVTSDISFTQTANWDTWNVQSIPVKLNAGSNSIQIENNNMLNGHILIDNLVLKNA